MNKQKLFRIMSILGIFYILFIGFGYVKTLKTRGEVIEKQIEVPADFARYFDRVLTRNRANPMAKATFMSPEGRRVNWQVFDGNYLLVNLWATWCGPCVVELPSLNKLQQRFAGKGLDVIAISIDAGRGQDDIKAFLNNRNIGEFAAYLDDVREVQDNVYMRGIPTTYLLDPKGNILNIFEGDAVWDSTASINFFESLVNQTNVSEN